MYPTMRERRGGIGRLVWWAFWVVLIVYLVRHPADAAGYARELGQWVVHAAEAVGTFFEHAAGGRR